MTAFRGTVVAGSSLLAVAVGASLGRAQSRPVAVREVNRVEAPPGGRLTAIVGGTVIDGRGGPPLEDGVVLVRGARIVAVGGRGRVAVPANATVVEATGQSVLPGLIDAHFHLDGDQGLPRLFLEHGVTSIRDPGAWIEAYDSVRRSTIAVPRLFLAGPHLDTPPPAYPEDSYLVRDPTEVRDAVNRFIDQGASVIKAYFRLPVELVAATTFAAHRRGIPVTAHLEIVSAADAIAAGIDGIEHVTSFGTALLPTREAERYRQAVIASNDARRMGRYRVWADLDLESDRARAMVSLTARRGVFVSATLAVFERRASDSAVTAQEVRGFAKMMEFTGRLRRAGAAVVAGSHSSVPGAARGWAYQREMELLVQSGLSPLEAIRAGTFENARFFRISERLGSLTPGLVADILLVEGRADRDIESLRRVRRVMLNGRWLDQ